MLLGVICLVMLWLVCLGILSQSLILASRRMSLAKQPVSRQLALKPWRWRRHRGAAVKARAQPPPPAG